MKKIKLVLLAISMLTMMTLSAQNKKMLDEKNGFREFKFGMNADSIPNLKLVESDGFCNYYEKTDEKLKIGDYDVKSITYGFYRGKLDFIFIEIKGYNNSRGILNIFESQYGKGYQSNPYIEKYYWFAKTVTLSYDENSINNNANIIIHSKMFDDIKKTDKKTAEEKAKSDL